MWEMRYKYYVLSNWENQEIAPETWPLEGRVEVLDWDPSPEQNHGIYGYLQESNTSLLPALVEKTDVSTALIPAGKPDGPWVVLGSDEIVRLDEQMVKCPWGVVLHCGNRESALQFVDLLKANLIRYEYLGEGSARHYMVIGKEGTTIATGEHALVIGGHRTTIEAGDRTTLIGGRRARIAGGNRSIISGGKGAQLLVGNKSTIAGGDHVRANAGHSSTVVGGYKASVAGGTLSTVVGGYKSTVSGGYGATVIGGDQSLVIGGDEATVIGGEDALVRGGKNAIVFGGYRSKVSGGKDATLRIAYTDEAGERNVSTAYVGRYGILPNVIYSFDGNSWCAEGPWEMPDNTDTEVDAAPGE